MISRLQKWYSKHAPFSGLPRLVLGWLLIVVFVNEGASRDTVLALARSDGDLDTAFGTLGVVQSDFGMSETVRGIALQSDGKIVVAGNTGVGSNTNALTARYLVSGTLDTSFGYNGFVTATVSGKSLNVTGVVVQPDDKIVVVGYARASIVGSDFVLLRYLPNGLPDTAFGLNGIVVQDIGFFDYANAVALQPDNKILVGGRGGSSDAFVISRYLSNGTLDGSFGQSGVVRSEIAQFGSEIYAMHVQSDGSIIATGVGFFDVYSDIVTARYSMGGSIDTTFGVAGVITTSFGADSDEAYGVSVLPDGSILIGGLTLTNTFSAAVLVNVDTTGKRESSFGTDGVTLTALPGRNYYVHAMALDQLGRIYLAGRSEAVPGDAQAIVSRYHPNGYLDLSFGSAGIMSAFPSNLHLAYAIAVQPDSRLVVGGGSMSNTSDLTLARLLVAPVRTVFLPLVARNGN